MSSVARAPPAASAAASTRSTVRAAARPPARTSPAGAPSTRTRARPSEGSMPGTVSTERSWAATTTRSSPAGSRWSAAQAPPSVITSPSDSPTATAAAVEPSARVGRSAACCSGVPTRATTADATALDRSGPEAATAPSPSSTIASSASPNPEPPCCSGRCSPAQPRSPACRHTMPGSSATGGFSSSRRVSSRNALPVANERTTSASSRWSWVMARGMTVPIGQADARAPGGVCTGSRRRESCGSGGFARQLEGALGDDVAQHLVGTAGDRVRPRVQVGVLPPTAGDGVRGLRRRLRAREHPRLHELRDGCVHVHAGGEVADAVAHRAVVEPAGGLRQLKQIVQLTEHLDAVRRDARALVRQAAVGYPPAVVHLADDVLRGDADVVEEDLVEVGGPGDLPQRTQIDARRAHVEGERGDSTVLGSLGVGAREQVAHVRVLAVGRPDLLAGDHVLVAVADRTGLQRREVAPCAGLAEQLAPDVLAAADPWQEVLLLLGRAELDDRRRGQGRRADRRPRAGAGDLLRDDEGLHRMRAGTTAVLGGPVDAEEPSLVQRCRPRPDRRHLLRLRCPDARAGLDARGVLLDELTNLAAEFLELGRGLQPHRCSTTDRGQATLSLAAARCFRLLNPQGSPYGGAVLRSRPPGRWRTPSEPPNCPPPRPRSRPAGCRPRPGARHRSGELPHGRRRAPRTRSTAAAGRSAAGSRPPAPPPSAAARARRRGRRSGHG